MQELRVIMLWNLPGSSAVKLQLINFAWLYGILSVSNPLSALCQKMSEGVVDGNVICYLQSSFSVWLPDIYSIVHPGFSSIDICFSWDLGGKNAEGTCRISLTSSRVAGELKIRNVEEEGEGDWRVWLCRFDREIQRILLELERFLEIIYSVLL